jgi:hypothetical protein
MTLDPVVKHDVATPLKPASQYSLRSLLVTMVTIGMVLAYARIFGSEGVWLTLLAGGTGCAAGAILGCLSGRFVEAITWSLVGGVLALCCVLSADEHVTQFQRIYWIMVGVVGGAYAGSLPPGDWRLRIALTMVLWLMFGLVSFVANLGSLLGSIFIVGGEWYHLFDAALALPVFGGLMLLAEIVRNLQRTYHTALDVWAAGLVFAVIAGNFGAMIVWNVWYA